MVLSPPNPSLRYIYCMNLLNEDRDPVLDALIERTHRLGYATTVSTKRLATPTF